ncbi:hypothetical protein Nepgr_026606 [Nepenthes gracilis]|uniref:Cytochrome c domain-containing protein n=1 Tax=Nepenthes gracilis TaxID=150966 RepID=A0AAD3Y0Q5_NEPGR|nr:hypothetical protein Nepgr_026606 [Nepenthes gracilis]
MQGLECKTESYSRHSFQPCNHQRQHQFPFNPSLAMKAIGKVAGWLLEQPALVWNSDDVSKTIPSPFFIGAKRQLGDRIATNNCIPCHGIQSSGSEEVIHLMQPISLFYKPRRILH